MFDKRNIKYIVILCVCFALTVILFILSFFLDKFFHVTTAGSCTECEAVVAAPYTMDETYCLVKVKNVKKYVEEEKEEKASASEEGVSCTLRIQRDDIVEGKETELKEGTRFLFLTLAPESSLKEEAVIDVTALRTFVDGGEQDVHVATLDRYNSEKNKKVKYTQIGMLCGVVFFFVGGGFCLLRLCGIGSKKPRW